MHHIIRYGKARFSVITENLIRCEYEPNGSFCDEETLFAVNRAYGEPNAEMYVRWTQFSALSACLRAHSERHAALDRRPWLWGEKESAIMRESYHLRSRLMPYIYSLTYRAYEKGLPLIEPLYYEYPDQEEAYRHNGEYFFGDALLCAPITAPLDERGRAKKTVWIGEGTWFDFFTGERFGRGTHVFSCPLDRFPLLVRGGIPLPMQEYTNRMTARSPETLLIRCYPGTQGSFTHYEDDGISCSFEQGEFLKTVLTYEKRDGKITVSIRPEGMGYHGMPAVRTYRIELMQEQATASDPAWTIRHTSEMTVIQTPPVPAHTPLVITLETNTST